MNHFPYKIITAPLPLPVDPLPLSPPSVPTPKLNLHVTLPLPDAVCYIKFTTLFDAAWTALLNGGPKINICCENAANYQKFLSTGGVSSVWSFDGDKSMTHKSKKLNHTQQQTRWSVNTPLSCQTNTNRWSSSKSHTCSRTDFPNHYGDHMWSRSYPLPECEPQCLQWYC